jgi:hypothetical protein
VDSPQLNTLWPCQLFAAAAGYVLNQKGVFNVTHGIEQWKFAEIHPEDNV